VRAENLRNWRGWQFRQPYAVFGCQRGALSANVPVEAMFRIYDIIRVFTSFILNPPTTARRGSWRIDRIFSMS
jgi:hypothetical protein